MMCTRPLERSQRGPVSPVVPTVRSYMLMWSCRCGGGVSKAVGGVSGGPDRFVDRREQAAGVALPGGGRNRIGLHDAAFPSPVRVREPCLRTSSIR